MHVQIRYTVFKFELIVILDADDLKHGNQNKMTLGGLLLEREFFKQLQQMMESSGVKDTVVINGWKDSNPHAKKEFDFLIVSLPLRAIIHIEVKRSLIKKTVEKVICQLNDGYSIIRSKIPFHSKSHWVYSQYTYFTHVETSDLDMHQFCETRFHLRTLNSIVDLSKWWTDLSLGKNETPLQSQDSETYLNILKYLLFQMYIQGDVTTQGKNRKNITSCYR